MGQPLFLILNSGKRKLPNLHFCCISMHDCELILWNRVRADDTKAFESLFKQYYPKMCLFANRYTHDITTSREIVQDVFIHLWEHRKELEIRSSFRSYLASAVRYNSIRRLGNNKATTLMDILPEPDQEFHDHLEYAELQAAILKAKHRQDFQQVDFSVEEVMLTGPMHILNTKVI